jgi:hypothetical protein
MEPSITSHAIERALIRLLEANGIATQAHDLAVAVTQYSQPALFAVIVGAHLRDALSGALRDLTGRLWATHWEVWVLSEADARTLLLQAPPEA